MCSFNLPLGEDIVFALVSAVEHGFPSLHFESIFLHLLALMKCRDNSLPVSYCSQKRLSKYSKLTGN